MLMADGPRLHLAHLASGIIKLQTMRAAYASVRYNIAYPVKRQENAPVRSINRGEGVEQSSASRGAARLHPTHSSAVRFLALGRETTSLIAVCASSLPAAHYL